ncbi:MAG TPA: hypothetical protein VK699_05215 [Terriglobales bacterium]|nr:hypothetical protein [Terriglobales bacterium]
MEIQFPIYVLMKDCEEVRCYRSLPELNWMEAIDVENEEYQAWDASGRVLQLTAANVTTSKAGEVSARATDRIEDPKWFAEVQSRVDQK